jgi:hypothetical protein
MPIRSATRADARSAPEPKSVGETGRMTYQFGKTGTIRTGVRLAGWIASRSNPAPIAKSFSHRTLRRINAAKTFMPERTAKSR